MYQNKILEFDHILTWSSIFMSIITRMVDIHQRLKIGQRNDWFNQFAWVNFCPFRDLILHCHLLSDLAIWGDATFLYYMMLKIGWRKDFVFKHSLICLSMWVCWGGGLWLIFVNQCACNVSDREISFFKLISISTT